MEPGSRDFYQKLREQIKAGADKISAKHGRQVSGWLLALPDMMALCVRLTFDKRVRFASKGILGVAVMYVISPIDLLPEAILGPIGLVDDLAFVVIALHKMKKSQENEAILRELWAGEGDVIRLIDSIAEKLSDFVDEKILAKIKRRIGGK